MKHFLQKYFSFLQPFILCVIIAVISTLAGSVEGVLLSLILAMFFAVQIFVYGKYFWEDE